MPCMHVNYNYTNTFFFCQHKAMAKSALLLFVFALVVLAAQSRIIRDCVYRTRDVYNVLDYGAVGDGEADDTKAFMDTWEDTCKSSENSPIMHVPEGKKFLLQPINFSGTGNCTSKNVTFQLDGELVAPKDPLDWSCIRDGIECIRWIGFEDFHNGLLINGSGTVNGQGSNWWNYCRRSQNNTQCDREPTSIIIGNSENVQVRDINFKDGPQGHICFEGVTGVYAFNLTIEAPGDSPNTDGIHLQKSQHVNIDQARVHTGDDCVSIGHGTAYVDITNMQCGPGHGISIGSLGRGTETVEHIRVHNAILTGTQNGVRIKTWQGGKGYARDIDFEHIEMRGVNNPIIIDQFYCPHSTCKNQTDAVEISNIQYDSIFGTSASRNAVHLACSETVPCTNILMRNVNLTSTRSEQNERAGAYCLNAHGVAGSDVSPRVPCLS